MQPPIDYENTEQAWRSFGFGLGKINAKKNRFFKNLLSLY